VLESTCHANRTAASQTTREMVACENRGIAPSQRSTTQNRCQQDLDTLTSVIGSAPSDISTLQSDHFTLSSGGLAAPAGASSIISAAQASIKQAIASANSDIDAVDIDVNQAHYGPACEPASDPT
jgi:hypothetical protein